jgi:multidrug resistance efflux pump
VSSSHRAFATSFCNRLYCFCLQLLPSNTDLLPLGTDSNVTTCHNFSFVDRQPQTAAEDLGMTSLLQAQENRIKELEAELEASQASVNKLQAENKRFVEREQEELWELVSPRAETARQEPAGCEPAASLQAARLEAAAESLPQKMLPASSGPLETSLFLQKDAEERSPDLGTHKKTYMRHPESGLAARLQSQEGQALSSGAREVRR